MDLSRNLRAARESIGLTLEQAATRAEIDVARLAMLESGASPTTYELGRAAHALGASPSDLMRADAEASSRTTARFRAPNGVTQWTPDDTLLLTHAAELSRIGASLLDLLERPKSMVWAHRAVKPVAGEPAPWVQGYELGEDARTFAQPSTTPISSVEALFVRLGIHVAYVHFSDINVLAASILEPGGVPIILLNVRSERASRPLPRRSVLAHELCHLLHDGGERELSMVSKLDEHRDRAEMRANGFAPAFLVPRTWLGAVGADPMETITDIADHWGLTFEGATWHAKNAKRISTQAASELRATPRPVSDSQFERDVAYESPDQLGFHVEANSLVRGLLSDLAIEAATKEHISASRAREILEWR